MQIHDSIFTSILFFGYLILWKIKHNELLKSEGVEVNVIFKNTRPIQRYFGVLEKIMTCSIVIIILLHLFFKDKSMATYSLKIIDILYFKLIGFVVGVCGLAICRIAQVTIGKSWRVGIDEDAKPGLIKNGIYKYIRNPTYTGLYLLCLGVLLINPTFLYSYWIFAFFLMMEFQVRCEEEYLVTQYGNDYNEYCSKTKRYIPFIY
jgi:protein-S-isoprenylcysteine O-methyltransferase Ste14